MQPGAIAHERSDDVEAFFVVGEGQTGVISRPKVLHTCRVGHRRPLTLADVTAEPPTVTFPPEGSPKMLQQTSVARNTYPLHPCANQDEPCDGPG